MRHRNIRNFLNFDCAAPHRTVQELIARELAELQNLLAEHEPYGAAPGQQYGAPPPSQQPAPAGYAPGPQGDGAYAPVRGLARSQNPPYAGHQPY